MCLCYWRRKIEEVDSQNDYTKVRKPGQKDQEVIMIVSLSISFLEDEYQITSMLNKSVRFDISYLARCADHDPTH